MGTGVKTSGGEGGIRTLGTGVSPYNGLANQSFSPPSLGLNNLQLGQRALSRERHLSFGCYCAPLCAPCVDTGNVAAKYLIVAESSPGNRSARIAGRRHLCHYQRNFAFCRKLG